VPPQCGLAHELLHHRTTEVILAEYYKVFNELGSGFKEEIFQRAMIIALTEAGLSVQQKVVMRVWFRGRQIGYFTADIVVENVVLLEIKAAKQLESWHTAQTLNYLAASDLEVALLLNFGQKPQFKRLILTNDQKVRPRIPVALDPC